MRKVWEEAGGASGALYGVGSALEQANQEFRGGTIDMDGYLKKLLAIRMEEQARKQAAKSSGGLAQPGVSHRDDAGAASRALNAYQPGAVAPTLQSPGSPGADTGQQQAGSVSDATIGQLDALGKKATDVFDQIKQAKLDEKLKGLNTQIGEAKFQNSLILDVQVFFSRGGVYPRPRRAVTRSEVLGGDKPRPYECSPRAVFSKNLNIE